MTYRFVVNLQTQCAMLLGKYFGKKTFIIFFFILLFIWIRGVSQDGGVPFHLRKIDKYMPSLSLAILVYCIFLKKKY